MCHIEVSDLDLLSNYELMKMYVCGAMAGDPGTVGSHRVAGPWNFLVVAVAGCSTEAIDDCSVQDRWVNHWPFPARLRSCTLQSSMASGLRISSRSGAIKLLSELLGIHITISCDKK